MNSEKDVKNSAVERAAGLTRYGEAAETVQSCVTAAARADESCAETDFEGGCAHTASGGGFACQSPCGCAGTDAETDAAIKSNGDADGDAAENTEKESDGAEDTVKPPPKKRHGWIWNIVLIVIIALGVFCLFSVANEITKEDGKSFAEVISGGSWVFAIVALCVVLGIIFLDCSKFAIINKAVIGKIRAGTAIKNHLLGKYYDAVTPFSTGGQPMQIYYLTTKGISGANSTAIVLIRYFTSIFCWLLIGAVCMIIGVATGVLDDLPGKTLLITAGWAGLAVNFIVPLFILSFVLFPKMAHKLTALFIGIGVKVKIVKDREKTMCKALKTVNDFITAFRIIIHRPLHLIALVIVCLAESTLTFSVPYFVMKALSCDVGGMFLSIMILNVFATFGVSFIPTPGNSGVVEGMGVLAFSLAAGATLAWAVLFWRFAVYYIYIIIGVGLTIFDLIKKNVKSRKVKNE